FPYLVVRTIRNPAVVQAMCETRHVRWPSRMVSPGASSWASLYCMVPPVVGVYSQSTSCSGAVNTTPPSLPPHPRHHLRRSRTPIHHVMEPLRHRPHLPHPHTRRSHHHRKERL